MNPSNDYASFLLRFQRVHCGSKTRWLASTQCALTGERHWFADVDGLIAFLHETFGECPPQADARPAEHSVPNRGPDKANS